MIIFHIFDDVFFFIFLKSFFPVIPINRWLVERMYYFIKTKQITKFNEYSAVSDLPLTILLLIFRKHSGIILLHGINIFFVLFSKHAATKTAPKEKAVASQKTASKKKAAPKKNPAPEKKASSKRHQRGSLHQRKRHHQRRTFRIWVIQRAIVFLAIW